MATLQLSASPDNCIIWMETPAPRLAARHFRKSPTWCRRDSGGAIGSARLSFASADRVKAHLGVEPGAVTPFALINDGKAEINVVLDADVMAADLANFHPLVNDRTTAIRPADLQRFIEACGHSPRIVDFGALTAG